MKKIMAIILVAVLLVLLVPTRETYMDGGSVIYTAVTYKVIRYHRLSGKYINNDGFQEGWGVQILGFTVTDIPGGYLDRV